LACISNWTGDQAVVLLMILTLLFSIYSFNNQLYQARFALESQLEQSRSSSDSQLELSRRALQNGLIYQMQKDEREVGLSYLDGKAEPELMFAVFQTIFIQNQLHSITPEVWPIFEQDFCRIMRNEHLKRSWGAMDKSSFSPQFISYIAELTADKSQICGGQK